MKNRKIQIVSCVIAAFFCMLLTGFFFIRDGGEKIDFEGINSTLRHENAKLETENAFFIIQPGAKFEKTIGGVDFVFRWCPATDTNKSFKMGSPEEQAENGRDKDETQHDVTFPDGLWILETEVTIDMYKAFANETQRQPATQSPSWDNPGYEMKKGEHYPVAYVSWYDAVDFCKWLENKIRSIDNSNCIVQLPTEAQWEYACRAGTEGAFAGSGKLEDMGWYEGNSKDGEIFLTHPVKGKRPNDWGLYDMHGSVWEMCSDWYDRYPDSAVVSNPTGPKVRSKDEDGKEFGRCCRGGAMNSSESSCRSANRSEKNPEYKGNDVGFRVVIIPKPAANDVK